MMQLSPAISKRAMAERASPKASSLMVVSRLLAKLSALSDGERRKAEAWMRQMLLSFN
jgi:hypothetical protein